MGEGGGEGKREAEEVAAGLKAAVSWQLGQALVSALQLRSGHSRSCDGSTRASAHPPTDFSRSGFCPFTSPPPPLLPFPPLRRGARGPAGGRDPARNPSGAARGQFPSPFFSLARGGPRRARQPRGAQPGGASEGRLGAWSSPAPAGCGRGGGARAARPPSPGCTGRRAPRLRGGRSGAPAARAGSPPWCSGVRDVEDAEEEEALAQQGAGVRGVLGRAPGRLGRRDPGRRGARRVPLPGAAPGGARRGHLLRRLGQGAQPWGCSAGGERDACQRAHQPGHPGCHPPLPRAHPSQDCEARYPGSAFCLGVWGQVGVGVLGEAATPYCLSPWVIVYFQGARDSLARGWGVVVIPNLLVGKLSSGWLRLLCRLSSIAARSWVS